MTNFRFGLRHLLVGTTLLAALLAVAGWYYRRYIEPRRQYYAIRQEYQALVNRRPPELTPRQWESAVAWTMNLHGNSLVQYQADGTTIRKFRQRLKQKLRGKVDLATIHWIWDEYALLCPGGANYQRFREMMMEEIDAGGASWGMNVP